MDQEFNNEQSRISALHLLFYVSVYPLSSISLLLLRRVACLYVMCIH